MTVSHHSRFVRRFGSLNPVLHGFREFPAECVRRDPTRDLRCACRPREYFAGGILYYSRSAKHNSAWSPAFHVDCKLFVQLQWDHLKISYQTATQLIIIICFEKSDHFRCLRRGTHRYEKCPFYYSKTTFMPPI